MRLARELKDGFMTRDASEVRPSSDHVEVGYWRTTKRLILWFVLAACFMNYYLLSVQVEIMKIPKLEFRVVRTPTGLTPT